MDSDTELICNSYHVKTLTTMVEAAGLADRGRRLLRSDLVSIMEKEFFTKARVQASYDQLNARERLVLNRLLLHPMAVSTRLFQRELIRSDLVSTIDPEDRPVRSNLYKVPYDSGYIGHPDRANSIVFQDIIARLTYHGLVFSRVMERAWEGSPHKIQFHPALTLYIPRSVRRFLPDPEPVVSSVPEPDEVRTGDPALLLRDLYLYWDTIRRHKVGMIKGGYVGKRWLKTINNALLIPDPSVETAKREDQTNRLYLLRQMLEYLNLLEIGFDGRLIVKNSTAQTINEFWHWELGRQKEACLEAWTSSLASGALGYEAEKFGPRYHHGREKVLRVIKNLPVGEWVDKDELVERVQRDDVNFLFADHTRVESHRGEWYYGSGGYYGRSENILQELEAFEVRFIIDCLEGILYQLGIIDLGYRGNRLVAVRLRSESSQEDETGKIIVQPNFQILALGPVPIAHLSQLDLIAEREQIDRSAFTYRLTRDSLYRGSALGVTVDQANHFLNRVSEVEIPQNITRSLEEWQEGQERIIFHSGVTLLQAMDDALMVELESDKSIGPCLLPLPETRMVLVKDDREKEIIQKLILRQLFPAVTGSELSATDHSVTIDRDGTIRSLDHLPHLHLPGRLAWFTDRQADGTWKLTKESILRKGSGREHVLRVIDELNKLNHVSIPNALIDRIKAWGSYYGGVKVDRVTLVEFKDRQTLVELLESPRMMKLLTEFPAGDRALALVEPDNLMTLREELDAMGINVTCGD